MKQITLLLAILISATISAARPSVYVLTDENATISIDSTHLNTWGYYLADHLNPSVVITPHAYDDLTLRAFMDEHDGFLWLQHLPARSIVLLQVGRHDMNTSDFMAHTIHQSFTHRLQAVAECCRRNKIQLVICTPLAEPCYKHDVLIDNLGGYDDVMRDIAAFYDLPLLDLSAASYSWLAELSVDMLEDYYEQTEPPYTLTQQGAQQVALMAVEQMRGNKKLAKLLK